MGRFLGANGIFQSALESDLLFELVKCSNCVSAAVRIEFEAFLSIVLTFGAVAVNRALDRSSAPFVSCFVMMLLCLLNAQTDDIFLTYRSAERARQAQGQTPAFSSRNWISGKFLQHET